MNQNRPVVNVLLVEDNPADALLVDERLAESAVKFKLTVAESLSVGIELLNQRDFDAILLDLSLPDSQGLKTFDTFYRTAPSVPLVILTGRDDEEFVTQAMRRGAQDYLAKDAINGGVLSRSIRYAIERNRRQHVERQLQAAAEIQRRLVPKARSSLFGFDILGRCVPAQYVGGDYFDFFPIGDQKLGVVIGDAAGHGVGPAMKITETRATIRALATKSDDVGEILSDTSRILSRDADEQTFVALFLASMDRQQGTIRYAAAGHFGSILDSRGRERKRLTTNDPPLGIQSHRYVTSEAIPIAEGESLFLYTDGLVDCENRDGSRFGVYRLMEALEESVQGNVTVSLRFLFEKLANFIGSTPRNDDLTVVVVRPTPIASPSDQPDTTGIAQPDFAESKLTRYFEYTNEKFCYSIVLREPNILTPEVCLEIQAGLFELVDSEPKHVVVSFENVERYSSEAINVLLRLRKKLTESNFQVVLCCMRKELYEAFQALNLVESVFRVVDDTAAAEALVNH